MDRQKSFSVVSYNYKNPSPQDMVNSANYFFILLCESVSRHMQEYLIEHGGKVRQWADPALPGSFSFESGGAAFQYDYFGALYEVKDGTITRPKGRFYVNRYQYPERDPNLLVKKLEEEFYGKHQRGQFLKRESAAAETAKKDLEAAKKEEYAERWQRAWFEAVQQYDRACADS